MEECSTPFGITANGNQCALSRWEDLSCAQRLSASPLMGIWGRVDSRLRQKVCSTPFGITANGNTCCLPI